MKIEHISVGKLDCNCYILSENNKVLVIDPGDEFKKIDRIIDNRKVVGVIITHHHFDHIGAISDLVSKYKCKVYDKHNLSEGLNKIDNFSFDVIYTPGHKEDSITIYFKEDKVMFCGDFIFKDSIGRCDLEGGDINLMFKSIAKIKKYDRDITLYPGHGIKTTLGYEMDNNIYFKQMIV